MAHFVDESVPDVVQRLSILEKIALLGGPNWWNTNAIDRLGIPAVRMSDGPNVRPCLLVVCVQVLIYLQGVRGSSHFVSTPAQCLPVSVVLHHCVSIVVSGVVCCWCMHPLFIHIDAQPMTASAIPPIFLCPQLVPLSLSVASFHNHDLPTSSVQPP